MNQLAIPSMVTEDKGPLRKERIEGRIHVERYFIRYFDRAPHGELILRNDEGKMEVEEDIARVSPCIRRMLDASPLPRDCALSPIIWLPQVDYEALIMVTMYMRHHRTSQPQRNCRGHGTKKICEWDEAFLMRMPRVGLLDMLLAATVLQLEDFKLEIQRRVSLGQTSGGASSPGISDARWAKILQEGL